MLFTRFALAALPLIGSAFGAPTKITRDTDLVEKDVNVLNIVTNFQNQINAPVTAIKQGAGSSALDQDSLTNYLTTISSALNSTVSQVQGLKKRDDLTKRQSQQVEEVGKLLAQVIQDVSGALSGISSELAGIPIVGSLIGSIVPGLNTLLAGVEVVLAGVEQVVDALLGDVGTLLNNLLNGLGLGGLVASLGL